MPISCGYILVELLVLLLEQSHCLKPIYHFHVYVEENNCYWLDGLTIANLIWTLIFIWLQEGSY